MKWFFRGKHGAVSRSMFTSFSYVYFQTDGKGKVEFC